MALAYAVTEQEVNYAHKNSVVKRICNEIEHDLFNFETPLVLQEDETVENIDYPLLFSRMDIGELGIVILKLEDLKDQCTDNGMKKIVYSIARDVKDAGVALGHSVICSDACDILDEELSGSERYDGFKNAVVQRGLCIDDKLTATGKFYEQLHSHPFNPQQSKEYALLQVLSSMIVSGEEPDIDDRNTAFGTIYQHLFGDDFLTMTGFPAYRNEDNEGIEGNESIEEKVSYGELLPDEKSYYNTDIVFKQLISIGMTELDDIDHPIGYLYRRLFGDDANLPDSVTFVDQNGDENTIPYNELDEDTKEEVNKDLLTRMGYL